MKKKEEKGKRKWNGKWKQKKEMYTAVPFFFV